MVSLAASLVSISTGVLSTPFSVSFDAKVTTRDRTLNIKATRYNGARFTVCVCVRLGFPGYAMHERV